MIIAVDPSIISLGCAAIRADGVLFHSGVMKTRKPTAHWTLKAMTMVDDFCRSAMPYFEGEGNHFYIELPGVWSGHPHGYKAAEQKSIYKLMFFVGALTGHASLLFPKTRVQLIPVHDWKGNCSKKLTAKRMSTRWNRKFVAGDEADAVGLATWAYDKEKKTAQSNEV